MSYFTNTNVAMIFLVIGLIAILASLVQLWRKGGIDKGKLDEVFEDDKVLAQKAATGIAARIKKLFHKG
jgi:hypothetical protein